MLSCPVTHPLIQPLSPPFHIPSTFTPSLSIGILRRSVRPCYSLSHTKPNIPSPTTLSPSPSPSHSQQAPHIASFVPPTPIVSAPSTTPTTTPGSNPSKKWVFLGTKKSVFPSYFCPPCRGCLGFGGTGVYPPNVLPKPRHRCINPSMCSYGIDG